MTLSAKYRQHAAECLGQSQRAIDLQTKALLLQLAQRWIDLAEQVSRTPLNEAISPEQLARAN
jgi:hypothetical protein